MCIAEWFDSVLQDVRYGLRQVRRTPVLVVAVVLSLTIGIGANTAIFSLVDAALLRPLPVEDPDSLRIVSWTHDRFPETATNINGTFSKTAGGRVQGSSIGANLYRNLARQQTVFAALVGVAEPNLAGVAIDTSPAEQVNVQYVSTNFFQGLAALPIVGRPFREDEDRIGREPVVIVSHRFWMRRFGGRATGLDRVVRVNNVPVRVVGVAPPGFYGLRAGQWNDVYAPLSARVVLRPGVAAGAPRGEVDSDWWVRPVGRVKPGISDAAAQAEIARLFANLVRGESTTPLAKTPEILLLPGGRGIDALTARDANALWILMLLVAVLLLIVCANVANLLLSRSVSRQRESAVRLALGAGRARLFRQHVTESSVLALMGGAAGLGLGYALAASMHRLFQSGRDISSGFDLHVDVRVVAYTSAVSLVSALLFGVAPAARAARASIGDALKAQTRSVLGGGLRLPRLLVSIQVGLCLAALLAAGLLGRSLANLKLMDVGFDRENLAYASVNPFQAGYSAARVNAYVERVREELARLPGVVRVSPVHVRLLSGSGTTSVVNIPGRPMRMERGVVDRADGTHRNSGGDGFLETLGIPLVAGRTLDRHDAGAKETPVVVDELFVRRFFPEGNPLGRRFGLNRTQSNTHVIVGVVRDSRYNSLRNEAMPVVYERMNAGELRAPIHFAIRARMDSDRLAETVRRAVAIVDPAVPLTEFHTQSALIDRLLRTERLLAFVAGAFGIVALSLAAIGIGGLLAYTVARRTNEIGVRIAMGAAVGDVVGMVLLDSLGMIAAGILIGAPCAYGVSRALAGALFGLDPLDPVTTGAAMLALFVIAALAAWVPARRAALIDPMVALREE